jgi:hypothetical protein
MTAVNPTHRKLRQERAIRSSHKRQAADSPFLHRESAVYRFLTPLEDDSSRVIDQRVGVRMASLHNTVSNNFAGAARGKRLTFAANGRDGPRVVIRALLYASEHDVFIFSRGVPRAVYSPAVFRNVVSRRNAPQIRILIDTPEQIDDDALLEMTDLFAPKGPIEVRCSPVSSPVHFVVVDKKHVWFQRDIDDEQQIMDLNATDIASETLSRLERLWALAEPISPPYRPHAPANRPA